jgi:tRNA G18 (ribose-2'-O)-methylase SpoU
MRDVIDEVPAPVYAVNPALAERVTGYHVHRGALASMQRKPLPTSRELLGTAHRIAVLESANDPTNTGAVLPPGLQKRTVRRVAVFEDIVDHANMGAAFRNAAALGVDAVFLTPRCADPLYRRSVKVSMGAVLQVPWTRLESWPQDIDVLRSAGFTVAALCLSDRAITLDELAARNDEKLALVFGTEGAGLTPGTLAAVDEHVRIPMDAGIDSLNVAAASAVAFYVTRPRAA